MSKTYSFGLDFYDTKEVGTLLAPIANIYIRVYSKWGNLNLITHECRSMREFNFEVDRLKDELEDIRESAKKKFNKFKKEMELRVGEKF